MRTLVVILIVMMTGSAWAANPAPRSKQLRLGALAYSDSQIWDTVAFRNWAADRWNVIIGQDVNQASVLAAIKARNSDFRCYSYDLFARPEGDTVQVKSWAQANGYNFDSLVIRMGTGPGDSAWCRGADGPPNAKTAPGGILRAATYFGAMRFNWDYRNPNVGKALTAMWLQEYASSLTNLAGFMVDEESFTNENGCGYAGLATPHFPFDDSGTAGGTATNGGNYWDHWNETTGHPIRRIQRPYSTALTFKQIQDSIEILRNNWAAVARDSLKLLGKRLLPNHNGQISPYWDAECRWFSDGKYAAIAYGGAFFGEGMFYYPLSTGNRMKMTLIQRVCADIAPYDVHMLIWGPRLSPCDTTGRGLSFCQMTLLGTYLYWLAPGPATFYFAHNSGASGNGNYPVDAIWKDQNSERSYGCGNHNWPDTLAWSDAMGKYFGVPKLTRDSTAQLTDGAGQAYRIDKVSLGRPTDTSKILTHALGRFTNGTTYTTATTVSTTMPSVPSGSAHNWHELLAGGTWSTAEKIGGDTVGLRNSQWRIFSNDTILANAGLPEDTTLTLNTASQTEATGAFVEATISIFPSRTVNTTFNFATSITGTGTGHAIQSPDPDHDYINTAQTVTILANQFTTTVQIPIINDALVEAPNETFRGTISSPPTGVIIGTAQATYTIIDNDGGVGISCSNVTVAENGGSVTFTINLTGSTANPASFNYATANGTAIAGTHYTSTSGSHTYTGSQTSKTVTVPILDNLIVDGSKQFTLNITSITGNPAPTPSSLAPVCTITDDDVAPPSPTGNSVKGFRQP